MPAERTAALGKMGGIERMRLIVGHDVEHRPPLAQIRHPVPGGSGKGGKFQPGVGCMHQASSSASGSAWAARSPALWPELDGNVTKSGQAAAWGPTAKANALACAVCGGARLPAAIRAAMTASCAGVCGADGA